MVLTMHEPPLGNPPPPRDAESPGRSRFCLRGRGNGNRVARRHGAAHPVVQAQPTTFLVFWEPLVACHSYIQVFPAEPPLHRVRLSIDPSLHHGSFLQDTKPPGLNKNTPRLFVMQGAVP